MALDIAGIATLITITGTTIYVLGLVALGYPVYNTITKNSSTSLFVVSVVPKTVVAGHGVRFLLGIPLIWTLLFAASLSVPQLMPQVTGSEFENMGSILGRGISAVAHELPVIISIAIVLILLGLHEIMRGAGFYNIFYPFSSLRALGSAGSPAAGHRASPFNSRDNIGARGITEFFAPSLIVANVIGCIGGALGGLILGARGISWAAVFTALVVIILMNFIANVLAVLSIKPPMPRVMASQSINGSEEVEEITGYLLAHSEGLWYIFDEEYTILRTIRDDKAKVDVLYP